MKWGKTLSGDSWHIIRNFYRVAGKAKSLCGRELFADVDTQFRATLDMEDKSCETCLRLNERQNEQAS